MKHFASLAVAGFLLICAGGAAPVLDSANGLHVDMVVPEFHVAGQLRSSVRTLGSGGRCYVVLRNESRKPIQVFVEGNSWGDGAVSYEATSPSGQKVVVTGMESGYDKNFPSAARLLPGESYVRPFHLRPDQMAKLAGIGPRFSVRAIFKQDARESRDLKSTEAWVGEAWSASVKVVMER